MTIPDAVIIGPQKAGTTWIHRYLEFRGDVCLPRGVKETMFFDKYFNKGVEWYAGHFHSGPEYRCTVEVSPTYFHNPDVPKRIHHTLGSIPLICTLRDPAERSFSLYLHMRRYGMTTCADFREAVQKHPEIIETSHYATHLKCWIDLFGQEKILVLLQEDLAHRQHDYARMLCEHLNLSFIQPNETLNKRVNAAALPTSHTLAAVGQKIADTLRTAGLYPLINWAKSMGLKSLFFGHSGGEVPSLSDEDRRWFIEKIGDELNHLEVMLQCDLSQWRKC